MGYTQRGLEEMSYIEMRLKQADSLNRIARDMNRSQSTISRESGRNTGLRGYRHKRADKKTRQCHAEKPKLLN